MNSMEIRMRRRDFLQTLPVAAAAVSSLANSASAQGAASQQVLVAYFSRTGNTRVIADQIREGEGRRPVRDRSGHSVS